MSDKDILVIGATGTVGSKIVDHLLTMGKPVRALIRPGTDAAALESKGVKIVRGDLTDRESLDCPIDGVQAVVTTATGYYRQTQADNIATVDDQGNLNLISAAKENGSPPFIFTSIIACDQAHDQPIAKAKWKIEQELEASGLPFAILRLGALFDYLQFMEIARRFLAGGWFPVAGWTNSRWTHVLADEAARCLATAAIEPKCLGKRIDIGSEPPISQKELHRLLEKVLGRRLHRFIIPFPIGMFFLAIGSRFSADANNMYTLLRFHHSGKLVADTRFQRELFGTPLTPEQSLRRLFSS